MLQSKEREKKKTKNQKTKAMTNEKSLNKISIVHAYRHTKNSGKLEQPRENSKF